MSLPLSTVVVLIKRCGESQAGPDGSRLPPSGCRAVPTPAHPPGGAACQHHSGGGHRRAAPLQGLQRRPAPHPVAQAHREKREQLQPRRDALRPDPQGGLGTGTTETWRDLLLLLLWFTWLLSRCGVDWQLEHVGRGGALPVQGDHGGRGGVHLPGGQLDRLRPPVGLAQRHFR